MSDLYAKQHIDSWKVSVCYNDQFLGAHMYLPNYVVAYSSLTACTTLITLTCCKLRISNHGVQGTTLLHMVACSCTPVQTYVTVLRVNLLPQILDRMAAPGITDGIGIQSEVNSVLSR